MEIYINQETLAIGDLYFQNCLEVVPDSVIDPNVLPPGNINLRADLFFNLEAVVENLKRRPYILHLNQEVPADILKQLKQNIPLVVFDIDTDTKISHLKSIIEAGIPLQLTTSLEPDEHQKIKLDYLDFPMIHRKNLGKLSDLIEKIRVYKNLPDTEAARLYLDNLNPEKIKFYSRKLLFSQGKIFLSTPDWRNNKSVDNPENSTIFDLQDPEFSSEIEHFRVYYEK